MTIVFYGAIATADYAPNENGCIAYLKHPPAIGDRLSLGNPHRLWTILDCDRYQPILGTGEELWLAHCTLSQQQNRADWFAVKQYQKRRSSSLWLYLGNGALILEAIDFLGRSPQTGCLVPDYNPADHTVSNLPWGIEQVITYTPAEILTLPCYHTIHLAHCVPVPSTNQSTVKLSLEIARS